VTNQPNLILFATDQPLLVAGLCEVLRLAGFDAEHAMLGPRDAFATVRREDTWLIFFDAKHLPAPNSLAQAVRRSPRSRFVLCGSAITAEMLHTAFDSCVHGVLSTDLPIEEAAAALVRIWQGERQIRFSGEPHCHVAPPPASHEEFDAEWMFGSAI
jgi:DNA-binding NarL/FixJ family response regulator